jgi:hypothetical protein
MANILKNYYKDRINILIIENRIKAEHLKKNYTRQWLTNLPSSIFKGNDIIKKILMDFGTNNCLGCHINVLETLLYLSCREMGVKFLFKNISDISFLKDLNVNIIFDATGNLLLKKYNKNSENEDTKDVKNNNDNNDNKIKSLPFSFNHIKLRIQNYYQNNCSNNINKSDITLVSNEGNIYTLFKNKPVYWYIIKIINIPLEKYDKLNKFIKVLNENDNKMYIWKGTFHSKLNEGLIFINLTNSETKFFFEINKKITLANLMEHILFQNMSDKIKLLCNCLNLLYPKNTILIEKPFMYKPYINDKPIVTKFNKFLIKIGDSLFNGDPKLGDGLGWHFQIINKIFDSITKIII